MNLVKRREKLIPCALGWTHAAPQSWQLMPCRAIVEEKSAKNENSENQNYLSLMANVGIIPYEEKGDIGNKKPEDLSKCKLVSKGDLVINSMNYGIGSYGISGLDGVCSPVYIVLKPISSVVHERYALRIFESKSFQQYAQSFGTGILEHRAAIGWDDLKNINVGVPSLAEQQGLLDYLDRETARIDALITKKTRFIELLREKRQALITHAVTKGLDPNVKMKDSGVEWLGEVPEHWEVKPIKWLSPVQRGASPRPIDDPKYFDDEGQYGWVRIEDVSSSNGHLTETKQKLSALGARLSVKLPIGSLFLSIAGTVGKACISQIDACIHDGFVYFPLLKINPEWLFRVFECKTPFVGLGKMGTQLNLNTETVGGIFLGVPPAEEIDGILKALQEQLARIDTIILRSERSTELLKERRSALITAAVTGQIDLREAA
jgi:type I restriction enzyme, S subunit